MTTSGWAVIGDSEGSDNDESDSKSSKSPSEPHEMRERLEARAIVQVIRAPSLQTALWLGVDSRSLYTITFLHPLWLKF